MQQILDLLDKARANCASTADFHRQMGVTYNTIKNWRREPGSVRARHLFRLAELAGVSIAFGESEQQFAAREFTADREIERLRSQIAIAQSALRG
jgi:transcriptional regulator with XRE-family HTH domain